MNALLVRLQMTSLCCVALLTSACVNPLRPGAPQPIRYFSADAVAPEASTFETFVEDVRLRHVTAAANLRERAVWRISDVEYGFYELNRWTEMPAVFLERALIAEFFERRGMLRGQSSRNLDVELLAFEEIVRPEHSVRVALHVHLADELGKTHLRRTIEVVRPVDGADFASVAQELRHALGDAVHQAGEAVLSSS